jgi:hypothetical protein
MPDGKAERIDNSQGEVSAPRVPWPNSGLEPLIFRKRSSVNFGCEQPQRIVHRQGIG